MLYLLVFVSSLNAATLEAVDPSFSSVVAPDARLIEIAHGQTWTEGPLPLGDGRLLFADIKSNSLRLLKADGAIETVHQPSGYVGREPYPGPEPGASAMARDAKGNVINAGHAGRALFRYRGLPTPGKKRETLVDRFETKRLNSPNDLVITKDGSIWFTDPPFGLPSQKPGDPAQELDFAGIFRLRNPGGPNQKLELMSRALKGPNGLAFSPDEKTLYVADTPTKRWVKFEVGANGALGAPRPFAETGADARPGEPDGLKVDRDGRVFAAGPGGVWVFAADGRLLGKILVPKKTSNVAFSRRKLYITASDSIYVIDVQTEL